jgi:hypothetical protein
MLADSTTATQIRHDALPAYHRRFSSGSTDEGAPAEFPKLDALLTAENSDGYTFQASTYAYENAKAYLEAAQAIFGRAFPKPEFVSDGEGGIDIEWKHRTRSLTLSCRGNDSQHDYLYWEENDQYDAKDVSLGRLITRLDWLNDA